MLLFHEGLDADGVRRMADAVMQKCAGCCAVFSKSPDGTYKYAIGEKDGDLRQFVREMNQALDGRGGGRPFFAQGSVKADGGRDPEIFPPVRERLSPGGAAGFGGRSFQEEVLPADQTDDKRYMR